jgi:hypothetical protein
MGLTKFGISRRGFLGGTGNGGARRFRRRDAPARAFGGQSPALALDALKPSRPIDEAYWWKVRSQFNVVDGLTFMNNGTLGPMPRVVFEANERYMREIMENPTDGGRAAEVDKVREKVASFVGATSDEIALTRSTTAQRILTGTFRPQYDDLFAPRITVGVDAKVYGPYKNLETGRDQDRQPRFRRRRRRRRVVGLYDKAITPRTKVIMVSMSPTSPGS